MLLNLEQIKKLFKANPIICIAQFGKKKFYYTTWMFAVIDNVNYCYRIGQSYRTKVCIEVVHPNGDIVLYEIGKYSRITSRQITQFFNEISLAEQRVYIHPDYEWVEVYNK